MSDGKIMLAQLNRLDRNGFVAVCGRFFEHSPWIAEQTWDAKAVEGFGTLEELHRTLVGMVMRASKEEQVRLIAAHPDLVGRLAQEGKLTPESTQEQRAAGLGQLSVEEITLFERYNSAYREKFGFPFVICARENKKDAILAAFPQRLTHTRGQEIQTALAEIAKIARLRLLDALKED
jgi:OHCU decarboxylase